MNKIINVQIRISENELKSILGNNIVDNQKVAEKLIGNIIERDFHGEYFNSEYLENVKKDRL